MDENSPGALLRKPFTLARGVRRRVATQPAFHGLRIFGIFGNIGNTGPGGRMTLTVKLNKDTEQQLDLHCRVKRITKSEVVSKLIENYLRTQAQRHSPFELAAKMKLVGVQPTAPAAARDHSRYLKEKLRARRAR